MSGRQRARLALAAAVALVIALAPQLVIVAGMTSIGGVDLMGGGGTVWDPEVNFVSCGVGPGYVPVADGSTDASDAFDGGLNLSVNGAFFDVPDASGNLNGQQLTVGPQTIDGLRIARIDRALATSPTLRDLVKLRNPSAGATSATIIVDTNLGSNNGATTVVKSSSGDTTFTQADRWVLTDDDTTDPPVTHIYYGRRAAEKVVGVQEAPGGIPGNDCIRVKFRIKVPARSTRYLLFFLQMHDSTDQGAAYAVSESDAKKFNDPQLNKNLLADISGGTRAKIANWDLA